MIAQREGGRVRFPGRLFRLRPYRTHLGRVFTRELAMGNGCFGAGRECGAAFSLPEELGSGKRIGCEAGMRKSIASSGWKTSRPSCASTLCLNPCNRLIELAPGAILQTSSGPLPSSCEARPLQRRDHPASYVEDNGRAFPWPRRPSFRTRNRGDRASSGWVGQQVK